MAPPLTAWQQAAKAYFYVVIWMSISMGVILFNKYILAYSGFKYPIALTLWHMVFCTSIATTMVHILNPTPYTLHPTPYTLHPTPYTLHPTP